MTGGLKIPLPPLLPKIYTPKEIMEIVNKYRKLGLTHIGLINKSKLVDEWANEELAKYREQENKDGHQ